jgi:ATP-dependent Zn protease
MKTKSQPQYLKLLSALTIFCMSLVGEVVFASPLPQNTVQESPQKLKTWRYSQFIMEVEKGNVKTVSIDYDLTTAIVTLKKKNSQNKQVTLVSDPDLINTLIGKNVDITVFSPNVSDEDKKYNPLQYSDFIKDVKNGNVEKVSLFADRSKALVTYKQKSEKSLVYLLSDKQLIQVLVDNNVDITVLPIINFNREER